MRELTRSAVIQEHPVALLFMGAHGIKVWLHASDYLLATSLHKRFPQAFGLVREHGLAWKR